jgi:hypothetical protein
VVQTFIGSIANAYYSRGLSASLDGKGIQGRGHAALEGLKAFVAPIKSDPDQKVYNHESNQYSQPHHSAASGAHRHGLTKYQNVRQLVIKESSRKLLPKNECPSWRMPWEAINTACSLSAPTNILLASLRQNRAFQGPRPPDKIKIAMVPSIQQPQNSPSPAKQEPSPEKREKEKGQKSGPTIRQDNQAFFVA